ncbi:uncharacterized protein LOC111484149 [Cucurbita maxima]|uniref:Uncharacterized protein LOC111484149 n=1 Tax=Cucurbita maxima TaxID=3661 RepID=A0A6J1J7F6_CUCMA|nr:uncharacterized protein LOC111484149 [Cucurbita maxima]
MFKQTIEGTEKEVAIARTWFFFLDNDKAQLSTAQCRRFHPWPYIYNGEEQKGRADMGKSELIIVLDKKRRLQKPRTFIHCVLLYMWECLNSPVVDVCGSKLASDDETQNGSSELPTSIPRDDV